MPSTIEALERELGEAQREKEKQERAVMRARNAHDAACAARDELWEDRSADDPEVRRLSDLVYRRRRELYEAVDRLKAAEGRERRIKSRLMYVLPAERRRYLSGNVDREFERFLEAMKEAYEGEIPNLGIAVRVEKPGELDLRGDATWRALERLYASSERRWVEIRASQESPALHRMARQISYYAGGHVPRIFVGGREVQAEIPRNAPQEEWPKPARYESPEGRLELARITARRYLEESTIERLSKREEALVQIAEIARVYQSMNLTGDEVRWRLEQLVSLSTEVLSAVRQLTSQRRRFSFYEIARAARLLDNHFPDSSVAAEALMRAVDRALRTGVPLVDVAYISVTAGEGFS